ncbi:MAG: winged helix-turn-helix domain-containing protein [Methanomicrobiales archaeon]|nr:winged helix-turn-helix domain-containing protein [Methanomicrobiales archaeon]
MGDLLQIVTSSEKRKGLLLLLRSGPKTWEEIKTSLAVTATGMLPQIKILAENHLVQQDGKRYRLTDRGEIVAAHLEPLIKTLNVLERLGAFWNEHDHSAIPPRLLARIGELGDIKIVEGNPEEIYEPHREFLDNILRSRRLVGIAPFVHPIYPEFFLRLAERGMEISLLLTEGAYSKIEKDYSDKLMRGLQYENAHLYVFPDDIRLAFVVTDIFFSVSFFFRNGVFDPKRDIVSFDPSARAWGEELFEHYRSLSREVTKKMLS